MRILWFTNTPSNYIQQQKGYNGGGWISSLESEIVKQENIELAVSFILPQQPFKILKNNVTYYPLEFPKQNKFLALYNLINENFKIQSEEINKYIQVIDDFKPDLIEIFGSEQSFGLIAQFIDTPIVLHIQGLINPCFNSFLPPSISWTNFIFSNLSLKSIIENYKNKKAWNILCKQEQEILRNINYYIGRTRWDKQITKIYNPNRKYFYGGEILRIPFYENQTNRNIPKRLTIISTISNAPYKGVDLILKTAFILKKILKINFEWKIFGNINPFFIEKQIKIKHHDVNISLMGVATAQKIKEEILNCTCFFHPSYIDNSPNSICEAQILGCTVISTNVGGISSLIDDKHTGYLIPTNDPNQAAFLIKMLYDKKELNIKIGNNAQRTALYRHNKKDIVESLIDVYKQILQ